MEIPADILAISTPEGERYQTQPTAFSFVLPALMSSDGMEVHVRFSLSVRVVDSPADLAMLKEQFFRGVGKLTFDDLRSRVVPIVHQAINQLASASVARDFLLAEEKVNQLALKTLNQFGFTSGLEFMAPIRAVLSSMDLSLRTAQERIDKERQEQIDRVSQISSQIKELGSANLLRVDEQASFLPILMKSQPSRPIYIAAGMKVIRYLPDHAQSDVLNLPESVGPIRSITQTDQTLLIGGQQGIIIRDLDVSTTRYPLPETLSDHGINSILLDRSGNRVFGTHSQLGLVIWDLSTRQVSQTIPINTPRNLIEIAGAIYLISGNELLKVVGEQLLPVLQTARPIISLLQSAEAVYMVQENGAIDRLEKSDLSRKVHSFTRNGNLLAAELLEVSGLSALLVSPVNGPVQILSSTGQPLLELLGPFAGIRMLTCSGCWIFGVSGDRQQLIVWDVDRPEKPCHAIHIAGKYGNRVADIC